MKIAIGNDHIVTDIKEKLKAYLEKQGHEVIDFGTYDFERTHYPIYGRKVGLAVVSGQCDIGIVMCGTGVGITNAANKVKGVRCVLAGDVETARAARAQLDANVLGMGGRVLGMGAIEDITDTFLTTPYNGENKAVIEQLNNRSSFDDDEHFFDEFLEKWERGEYHD